MAKLNDVHGQATENLEVLKRRFLRQNRDLAKTNSFQSVRIRTLEAEVSRLSMENIDLREEIIRLRNAQDEPEILPDTMTTICNEFQDKLHQLNSLVLQLNDIPKRKSSSKNLRKEPLKRPERNLEDELLEGRLPDIEEDKQWPISSLSAPSTLITEQRHSVDSIDLSSPPVARFDLENSITTSALLSIASPDDEEPERPEESSKNQDININIEMRRKRKDSSRKLVVFNSSPESISNETSKIERKESSPSNRKRKLGDRFTEKNDDLRVEHAFSRTKNTKEITQPIFERKALAIKPVNTDPMVSPKKSFSRASSKALEKKPALSSKDAARERIRERRMMKETQICQPPLEISLPQPPKTPAPEDLIFSPQSQDFSSEKGKGEDTPPPSEAIGRSSRRARSAVNYAEPNLISKMRRPTKELVDAVGKDGRPVNGSIVNKKLERPTSQWKPAFSASVAEDLQRYEPPSPLGSKTLEIEENAGISAQSRRKTHAGTGIATSLSMSSQRVESTRKATNEAKKSDASIFDFVDSSPNESQGRIDNSANGSSSSRRHSTVGNSAGKAERKSRQAGGSMSRRRSMMV